MKLSINKQHLKTLGAALLMFAAALILLPGLFSFFASIWRLSVMIIMTVLIAFVISKSLIYLSKLKKGGANDK